MATSSNSNSIVARDKAFRRIVRRGFLLPIVVMAVGSFLLAGIISHLLTVTNWVDRTDRVIAQAQLCQRLLVDMESGVRGYQITSGEPLLEPFHKSRRQLSIELNKLAGQVADNPEELQRVIGARAALTNWLIYADQTIERKRVGDDVEDLGMNVHGQELMDAVQNQFDAFIKAEVGLRHERFAAVGRIEQNIRRFRLVTLIALGVAIGFYVRRQLTHVARIYEQALATVEQKTAELQRSETSLKDAEGKLRQYADTLEATVAQRTAQLQETIAQLKAYSYSISHDLRAPLRAMHGYATILLDDFQDRLGPGGKVYLERILSAAERMDNLIQGVLSYSQLANSELKPEAIDLDHLIHDVIQHYPVLSSAAVNGRIRVETPLPRVMAPQAALSQCVSNLLTNAVKFVPDGEAPDVRLRAECENGDVRLWVEDKGIGIAPEYQSRIFGVFERIPGARTYEGTGIGLAIVQKAVERMGGKVGVESELGKGSRFWILLPGMKMPD
jgi:signal transduction histidine kinase